MKKGRKRGKSGVNRNSLYFADSESLTLILQLLTHRGSYDYKSDALPTELRQRSENSILANHLERETGIEPATNSLEGCDSTIELLPHWSALNHLHCTALYKDAPVCPRRYFHTRPR